MKLFNHLSPQERIFLDTVEVSELEELIAQERREEARRLVQKALSRPAPAAQAAPVARPAARTIPAPAAQAAPVARPAARTIPTPAARRPAQASTAGRSPAKTPRAAATDAAAGAPSRPAGKIVRRPTAPPAAVQPLTEAEALRRDLEQMAAAARRGERFTPYASMSAEQARAELAPLLEQMAAAARRGERFKY